MKQTLLGLGLGVLLSACVPELVEWEDVQPAPETATVDRTGGGAEAVQVQLAENGEPMFVAPPPAFADPENACPGSVVFAPGRGDEWYAAWWAPRGDGSVELLTARSDDGGVTWRAPVPAERRDRSGRGCARPAPGIAVDSVGGYVHLAYFVEPPGEAGVWYSHSMERGELWHEAVGVMYGRDPAVASVAANADTVVVAFEHPNAAEGRIGLAVSRTAGHIIEGRTVASVGSGYAREPRVAVRGRDVAVVWTMRGPGVNAAEHVVMRRGRLRPLPKRGVAAELSPTHILPAESDVVQPDTVMRHH